MDDETSVAIAGAGPVGLALAVGLAMHGVRSVVLEQNAQLDDHSRALGILPRTLEILRGWGCLEEFLSAGAFFRSITLYSGQSSRSIATADLSRLADYTAIPGVLILPQDRTVRILLQQAQSSGMCEVRFGHTLRGFAQQDRVVAAQVGAANPYTLRSRFLVGCDGAHSTVRKELGWELEGRTYTGRVMLADVAVHDDRDALPWPRVAASERGGMAAVRYDAAKWRIVCLPAMRPAAADAPDAAEVEAAVEKLLGRGEFTTLWSSLFSIHCRNSPHFRRGTVLIAGDAAHLNSPAGGQGMNSGIQDAHNLAWKLARALGGADAERLLASYEEERRDAVLHSVDRYTDALTHFVLQTPRTIQRALMALIRAVLARGPVPRPFALRGGMLKTRYTHSPLLLGPDHRIGCRAFDGDLLRTDGTRVRLLDLAGPHAALLLFDDGQLPGWNVDEIRALLRGVPDLEVVRIVKRGLEGFGGALSDSDGRIWAAWGGADGALAALIRPDGYIGWVGQRPEPAALRAAVRFALGMLAE